ncbi:MAG: hypothetical protein PVJ57_10070 [Phycisphaerae bacterium]|jgi:hypothetical protein
MTRSASPASAAARTLVLAAALGFVLLLATGCWSPTGQNDLQHQVQLQRETIAQQTDQIASLENTVHTLEQRLDDVRAIKPSDLEKIFYPEKIEICSLSGGYDADGQPGDDGVVVYLRPLDREGDALKVAGEIRVQLYDLAAPPPANLLGEYTIPVEQARELWYGKLLTYHYKVMCPWLRTPPEHPEITIRAMFVDYLTQRVLSTQQTCTVKLAR